VLVHPLPVASDPSSIPISGIASTLSHWGSYS